MKQNRQKVVFNKLQKKIDPESVGIDWFLKVLENIDGVGVSNVDLAVQTMISILKKKYPALTFEHTKKLSLSKIIQYPIYQ